MKLRSITYFLNPGWPLDEKRFQSASAFIGAARAAYTRAGYEVQTARLASVPFSQLISARAGALLAKLAQEIENMAGKHGFEYVSLGPAQPQDLTGYRAIPEALAATQNAFFSGLMTSAGGSLSLPAVRACADIIQRAATLTPDGIANLRFAALANVAPNSPFLPAAYHQGDAPAFALATEAADLAVEAFTGASSLAEARQRLVASVEAHARALEQVSEALSKQFGLEFKGIDFSLAPFPDDAHSVGNAFEKMGVPAAGLHGSLAAAAILTDTLDSASFHRVGFSGLFTTVLEDSILGKRAASGDLTVKDLLLYSAVCGTGIDTVPLPGDTSVEALSGLLLDLAALAVRLNKPLTARLLPVPGKKAGDPTGFDFAFFTNSRVMKLEAEPLTGLLAGDESFELANLRWKR